jgi:hypothetical protein
MESAAAILEDCTAHGGRPPTAGAILQDLRVGSTVEIMDEQAHDDVTNRPRSRPGRMHGVVHLGLP